MNQGAGAVCLSGGSTAPRITGFMALFSPELYRLVTRSDLFYLAVGWVTRRRRGSTVKPQGLIECFHTSDMRGMAFGPISLTFSRS